MELKRFRELESVEIVTRKGQPRVQVLEGVGDIPLTPVSSSWISALGYRFSDNTAEMETYKKGKEGITYRKYPFPEFPFDLFEKWASAHSKGTFYHERVKDLKYAPVGIGKFLKRLGMRREVKRLRKAGRTEIFAPYEEKTLKGKIGESKENWRDMWERTGKEFERRRELRRKALFGEE